MARLLSGVLLLCCAVAYADEDPYLWLEDVEGEKALAWVEEQNKTSLGYLEALPTFATFRDRNLEIYDSDERIASPTLRGSYIHNFWRDADNKRGLWRRATLDDYAAGKSSWEIILDLDKLAEQEGEDWVWKGSSCLRPEYRHCLLRLSRGGADADRRSRIRYRDGRFRRGRFLPRRSQVRPELDRRRFGLRRYRFRRR